MASPVLGHLGSRVSLNSEVRLCVHRAPSLTEHIAMGHESRIEPWLPLTTVLLVSFRADWLRREEAKTAKTENRNCWVAVFSIRVDCLAGQNSPLITWGWKQEKLQPSREKNFLLTSPSIELPSS
jgi:hypothetical protein